MKKELVYYYDNQGQCYIYKETKDQHCQLHGEYIRTNVWGIRIKTSGKVGSTCYATPIENLHPHSKEYLKYKKLI